MNKKNFSEPLDLTDIDMNDTFFKREMELVRTEVIPYQWDALNDNIPEAAKSFCMHNFKVAGKLNREKRTNASGFVAPKYTFRGFEALPEDENKIEDKFYGFVFQDTDLYKWIEAVGYSLTQHPDEKLEELADKAIDVICEAQLDNGYLDTYYIINGMDKAFSNLRDHHELYCLGHLVEGAVAYYEATGKRKLLETACKFADYCVEYFGDKEGQCKGYPGHEIAEMALVRLYNATGNVKYLELSEFFISERGKEPYYFDTEDEVRAGYTNSPVEKNKDPMRYAYHQAHKPVKEQSEAVGHAVRAVYLYSGMADIARLTGDEELYRACEKLWESIVNEKLYITGGIGGTHVWEAFSFPFDLPNDTAYSETCAAIGLVFFARRMLQIHADSRYADVMEMALYNTVLSGMALDGKSFFYVNPLEVYPEACKKDARKFHVKAVRQKWFGCACCPPNIARLVSSIGSYAYTSNEDTLFFHLYVGATISAKLAAGVLKIKLAADMPWDGKVSMEVLSEEALEGTIAFRIPGWAEDADYAAQIHGKKTEIKDGYLYCTGTWKKGDTIELQFAMRTKLIQSNTKVRENEGTVAVRRGPITYCIEEADNGKDLHLLSVDMKELYGEQDKIQIIETSELGQRVNKIVVPGYRKEEKQEKLYQEYEPPVYTETPLVFIPYFAWANRGEGEMRVWVNEKISV